MLETGHVLVISWLYLEKVTEYRESGFLVDVIYLDFQKALYIADLFINWKHTALVINY